MSAKLPFKSEGDIKTLADKQKLKSCITIRPGVQEILKDILQIEIKQHYTVTWRCIKKLRSQ